MDVFINVDLSKGNVQILSWNVFLYIMSMSGHHQQMQLFFSYICFEKQLFILQEEKVILQRSDFYHFLFMEQAIGIL